MSMTREYRGIVKTGCGPCGPPCRCCRTGRDKIAVRRAVRRKLRSRPVLQHGHSEDWGDPDWYGEDYYYDDEPWRRHGVTWRMTLDPFRLVPAWVREGAEEAYEMERAVWALAGERICWRWGVPAEDCASVDAVLRVLHLVHQPDWALFNQWGWVATCYHDPW